jgi:precorrin-2 methylase
MYTPKTLSDLNFQDNVVSVKPGSAPETIANRFFHDLFDAELLVSLKRLFEEDGKVVYEAYQDSGSVEYLYLIK